MLDEKIISAIVEEVLRKLKVEVGGTTTATSGSGVFSSIDEAVEYARKAQLAFMDVPIERRKKIIDAMRKVAIEHAEELSQLAVDETGLGRYEDKV
ncbi:MAG TPA: aldehyde dehydrogenase family protein, partial [Firmicutes bacterium]|nr:aldehyde dehydrogenase family protein [Bacillota bacterium]